MANTSSDSDLDTGNLMLVLSPADFTDLARAVNAAGTVGALSPQRAEAVCRLLAAAQPAGPRYLLVTREICCDGRDALEFEQHETRDGLNAAVLKHALEYRDDIWAFDRGVEIDDPRMPGTRQWRRSRGGWAMELPWADARPGMVLVDRDADGEITGVALVGDDKVWRWVWTPYGIGRWGACGMSDGVLLSADADAEQGEIVAVLPNVVCVLDDDAVEAAKAATLAWLAERGEQPPEGMT